MIRHILFWKLQEEYREGEKRREAEARLAASVETLAPIPGLHNAKIGPNLAGGEYDLVFYADLDDRNPLAAFRDLLGTSRDSALLVLECLDRNDRTRREGNLRRPGRRLYE